MGFIIDFFNAWADAFVKVVDFYINLISDLIYIIKITGAVLEQLPALFAWLPSELGSILIIGFGIVVIYKIFGREG